MGQHITIYAVDFYANGTLIERVTVDDTYNNASQPCPQGQVYATTGQIFIGWQVVQEDNSNFINCYNSDDTLFVYDLNVEWGTATVNAVYADEDDPYYRVTLNSGDLGSVISSTLDVTYGEHYNNDYIDLPSPEPNNGYEFMGWDDGDDTIIWLFRAQEYKEGQVFTAVYQGLPYSVNLYDAEGNYVTTEPTEFGSEYSLPEFESVADSPAGYTFQGWLIEEALFSPGTSTSDIYSGGDIDAYPKFRPNELVIRYCSGNGDSSTQLPCEKLYGDYENGAVGNYGLWNVGSDGLNITKTGYHIESDYAWCLSHNSDVVFSETESYTCDELVSILNMDPDNADVSLENSDITIEVIPNWQPNIYKVTLDKQGGVSGTEEYWYKYNTITQFMDGSELRNVYYYWDAECTIPIFTHNPINLPTRKGFNFIGYFEEANNTGSICYVDSTGIRINNLYATSTNNITLYAVWEEKDYVITFVDKDQTVESSTCTHRVYYCEDYELPNESILRQQHEGYTFDGWKLRTESSCKWFVKKSGTEDVCWLTEEEITGLNAAGDTYEYVKLGQEPMTYYRDHDEGIVCYAVWKGRTLTINYWSNGATDVDSSTGITYGENNILVYTETIEYVDDSNTYQLQDYTDINDCCYMTRAGYWNSSEFTGGLDCMWEVPAIGTPVGTRNYQFTFGELLEMISSGNNIDLYAIWHPMIVRVVIHDDEGEYATSFYYHYKNYKEINDTVYYYFEDYDCSLPLSRLDYLPSKSGHEFSGFNTSNGIKVITSDGSFVNDLWNTVPPASPDDNDVQLFAVWDASSTIFVTIEEDSVKAVKSGKVYVQLDSGKWVEGTEVYVKTSNGWKISKN